MRNLLDPRVRTWHRLVRLQCKPDVTSICSQHLFILWDINQPSNPSIQIQLRKWSQTISSSQKRTAYSCAVQTTALMLHVGSEPRLIDWLTGWLTDWRTDGRTDWLTEGRTDWLTDWTTDGLTYWLTGTQTDWLNVWLTDWLTDWLTNRLTDWLTD